MNSVPNGSDGYRRILTPEVEIIENGELEYVDDRPLKRMAIVDTCNVIHQAGRICWKTGPQKSYRRDAIGVMLVAKALLSEGFDCRLLVPNRYTQEQFTQNAFILKVLKELGLLVPIDEGSHDDLVLLELAKTVGGFVISNDQYRDHTANHLRATIQTRRCGFHLVPIPKPDVQSYHEFISNRENRFLPSVRLLLAPASFETMFAQPGDATYEIVFQTRLATSQRLITRAHDLLDLCADYVQKLACVQEGIPPPALDYCDPDEGGTFEHFRNLYNRWRRSKGLNDA